MTEKEFITAIEDAVENSIASTAGFVEFNLLEDESSNLYEKLFPDGIFDREAEIDNENEDNAVVIKNVGDTILYLRPIKKDNASR